MPNHLAFKLLETHSMIDLKTLSEEGLQLMYQTAAVMSETMRVMQKSATNVVSEILKTTDNFLE